MNALTYRPFAVYFTANTVSLLGTWIQKVGIGWLAWQVTGSVFWTSFISIVLMAPVGILSPFVAVYAESWGMRRAFMTTKILMVGISSIIWLLEWLDLHSLHTLVATSLAIGVLGAVGHPVRLVFISVVVPRDLLPSAIGLNSASWNMSRIVGPGISGFAIVLLGLANTLALAVLCFLPMIVALAFIPLSPRASVKKDAARFFGQLLDGFMIALRTPMIFAALCMVGLNSFLVRGVLEIQPAIVGQVLGGDSRALAAVTAAAGTGSLLASIWIGLGRLSPDFIRRSLWPMLVLGILGTALLNATGTVMPMSAVFVATGFTATIVGIGSQTLIQLEVQEDYRARVMSWWSTISFGGLSIGGVVIGFFGDLMPIGEAILMVMVPGALLAVFTLAKLPLLNWQRQGQAAS